MLGPCAIDTYLPAFSGIAADLQATPLQIQQTLSAYLFAFAFMSLFHGALSDSFGRRPVVLTGVVSADRSEGFFRRWRVLPFPHRFVDADEATGAPDERIRDKHAVEAVITPGELSGFLVRAVRGTCRTDDGAEGGF